MKTPLQEMFNQLKASRKDEYGLAFAIDMLLENEKTMLEKEKEVIVNAWIKGHDLDCLQEQEERLFAELYYEATFNTKEK